MDIEEHLCVSAIGISCDAGHCTRWALGAAEVLQAEDDFENLWNRLRDKVYAHACVHSRAALQLIVTCVARGVDLRGVREMIGLSVVQSESVSCRGNS